MTIERLRQVPVVEDTRQVMKFALNPISYLDEKTQEHGDFFFTKLGVRNVCVVSNHAAIGEMLLNKHQDFVQSSATHLLNYFLGKGILTTEGEKWKAQRKRLLPFFSVKSVTENIERYARVADEAVAEWDLSEEVDLLVKIKRISISVILSLITGKQPNQEVVTAFQEGTDYVMEFINMTRNPFSMRRFAGDIHQEMINRVKVVDQNIYKLLKESSSPLLDKMKQAGVSDKAIRDEVVTLIAAGYESTSHAASSSVYFIEKHPEVKQKVLAELDQVFTGHQDIFRLRYLLNVVKESMRLHPPGWMFFRKANRALQLNGYSLPKDTDLMINLYNLHRDPSIWEKPATFDPDRFEQERLFPEHAYIPFGTGVRFCIGRNLALQEIVYILAHLYKKHEIAVDDIEKYALKPDITLGLGGPFLANLKRRK